MVFRQKAVYLPLLALLAALAAVALVGARAQLVARGTVRDQSGPLAGAVVRARGSDRYALTDAQGGFRLPLASADAQLAAWAPGFYIGGGPAADFLGAGGAALLLRPHHSADNPDYAFIDPLDTDNPDACVHCHRDRTGGANSAMPVDEWLLDAHSQAATNPRFLSLYNGTDVNGAPGAPTVFTFDAAQGIDVPAAAAPGAAGAAAGFRLDFPDSGGSCATCHAPVLAVADPYAADPNAATGAAAGGVTCDFCHKIQDVPLRPDGLPDPGLPGVLSIRLLRPPAGAQIFIGPYDDAAENDVYSALQSESRICAACHSGQFWDVRIYDSFGEWLSSPYSDADSGQTCQDCHMPPTGSAQFVQFPPGHSEPLPARSADTVFSHRMPGAADQALLANTAEVELDALRAGDRLRVTVRVTNSGAGHHIPTDNPLRNLILLVAAADGAGQPLALAAGPTIPAWGGEGDPARGYYAGEPGVLYAKVLADTYTGETPAYAYWRPTRLVSDNRIPALAADETVYEFALPADAGGAAVTARLYLRRAFIALMDAKQWDTPDILMEERTVTLP